MAKNITLLGASYPAVPAVVLPQTGGGNATFVDPVELIDDNAGAGVTDKTWSADKLVEEFADTEMSAELTTAAPIQSFPDGAPYPMSLQFAIEPVQSGSGDPSPSNVRPITGWTGANVTVAVKNLISELEQGNIDSKGAGTSNTNRVRTGWIRVNPNTTYTLNAKKGENTTLAAIFAFKNKNTGEDYTQATTFDNVPVSITTNNDVNFVRCTFRTDPAGAITPADITAQLEEGATATEYSQFANENHVTFPTSAGTVYGGTVTVNPDGTGELVVDRGLITVDGTETFIDVTSANVFYLAKDGLSAFAVSTSDDYCNMFKPVRATGSSGMDDGEIARTSTANSRIYVKSAVFAGYTAEQLASYFASNNLQLCLELISPVTYSLTPGQVLSLLGLNNVWADTGDIKALSYVRNTVPEMIRQDTEGQIKSTLELTIAELWNI